MLLFYKKGVNGLTRNIALLRQYQGRMERVVNVLAGAD